MRSSNLNGLLYRARQVDRLTAQFEAPAGQARHIEQVIEEAGHLVHLPLDDTATLGQLNIARIHAAHPSVAVCSDTGTCTKPNETAPFQMDREADFVFSVAIAHLLLQLKFLPGDGERLLGFPVVGLSLPLINVVRSHSGTRLSLPGPRASLLRTASG